MVKGIIATLRPPQPQKVWFPLDDNCILPCFFCLVIFDVLCFSHIYLKNLRVCLCVCCTKLNPSTFFLSIMFCWLSFLLHSTSGRGVVFSMKNTHKKMCRPQIALLSDRKKTKMCFHPKIRDNWLLVKIKKVTVDKLLYSLFGTQSFWDEPPKLGFWRKTFSTSHQTLTRILYM